MEINNLKDIGNFIYKYRFILILALVIGFSYGFLKQKFSETIIGNSDPKIN